MFGMIAFTDMINTNPMEAAGERDPSLKLNCHAVAQWRIVNAQVI